MLITQFLSTKRLNTSNLLPGMRGLSAINLLSSAGISSFQRWGNLTTTSSQIYSAIPVKTSSISFQIRWSRLICCSKASNFQGNWKSNKKEKNSFLKNCILWFTVLVTYWISLEIFNYFHMPQNKVVTCTWNHGEVDRFCLRSSKEKKEKKRKEWRKHNYLIGKLVSTYGSWFIYRTSWGYSTKCWLVR